MKKLLLSIIGVVISIQVFSQINYRSDFSPTNLHKSYLRKAGKFHVCMEVYKNRSTKTMGPLVEEVESIKDVKTIKNCPTQNLKFILTYKHDGKTFVDKKAVNNGTADWIFFVYKDDIRTMDNMKSNFSIMESNGYRGNSYQIK